MKILALDFSSPERSVAVVQGSLGAPGDSVYEAVETGGRGAHAFAMIEQVLQQAGLEREQINVIAVGLGPGSYTGIRTTIALAQGWQLARPLRSLGINSVDCLVEQAIRDAITGPVQFVVDAQRGEFYLQSAILIPGQAIECSPLRLATRDQVLENPEALLIGPEVHQHFKTGRVMFPRAATLGSLALRRTDSVPAELLEPVYLRQPQFVKAPPPRILPG